MLLFTVGRYNRWVSGFVSTCQCATAVVDTWFFVCLQGSGPMWEDFLTRASKLHHALKWVTRATLPTWLSTEVWMLLVSVYTCSSGECCLFYVLPGPEVSVTCITVFLALKWVLLVFLIGIPGPRWVLLAWLFTQPLLLFTLALSYVLLMLLSFFHSVVTYIYRLYHTVDFYQPS